MEFADEGDLDQHIKHQRDVIKQPFQESLVRNWLGKQPFLLIWKTCGVCLTIFISVQLALALQYLHTKVRVMHRDLKTQNIFMTSAKLLKLGDFGVSKMLDPGINYAKTSIGTPVNICPEIVNGQPYDFKSDIWSLGCVIYEICQQRPAFQYPSLEEIVKNIKAAKYTPIPNAFSGRYFRISILRLHTFR